MLRSLKEHWPEYLCEAAELGLFMISASLFTILLWHPSSPALNVIPNAFVRRMLTVMAMGGTAIALIFSPLGKRSGAHFNPAVTLTFWRLGKVKNWDAFFLCRRTIHWRNRRRVRRGFGRARNVVASDGEVRCHIAGSTWHGDSLHRRAHNRIHFDDGCPQCEQYAAHCAV